MYEVKGCRICESTKLKTVLDLGLQYLSEFRDDDKRSELYPLELVICEDCNQVQLRHTIPQNLLYTNNYGYRSGINNTMKKHLKDLVKDALHKVNYQIGDKFAVVDYGSNDGTLLKNYPEALDRYGFDLVEKFAECYKNTDIYFTTNAINEHYPQFKIITAISMFYDIDDPVKFLLNLKKCLDETGIIVIQQNYLLSMLQSNGFENIGYEHLMYYSLDGMLKLCDKVGLDIFDVLVNDLNGGSFRTYLCHKGEYEINKRVQMQLDLEREYDLDKLECYEAFRSRVNYAISQIREFLVISQLSDRVTYILAASTRGNTLLQTCKITPGLCPYAIERNPEKYGKNISSVGIPIISEDEGLRMKPDYLLVLPWFFKDEICQRYIEYIKNGGKLIFPLPKLEIVGYKDGGIYIIE